ncbi:MAG: right-handed parallel beta-helix repeat-containing protein [Bacteroidales bacterium]|nr:right-handed parallel beta-helix repeat-containing protein [Bacteroidales bacterium]
MKGDIVVELDEGTYCLTETFCLSGEDSGNNGHNVIYRAVENKNVCISGGKAIENWMLEDSLFVAPVKGLKFRQIYVNGKRAIRSRTPNAGDYYKTKLWDLENKKLMIDANYIKKMKDIYKLEMVMLMKSADAYLRINDMVLPTDSLPFEWLPRYAAIRFCEPEQEMLYNRALASKVDDIPFYFENSLEFIDQPGEWHLDQLNEKLYYKPRDGETIHNLEVVAPYLETLVQIKGALGNPARNIQFKGLQFMHTTWLRPDNKGNLTYLAGQYVSGANGSNQLLVSRPPAAVQINMANNIVIEKNIFMHLGATALDIQYGAGHNTVAGNLIQDVSGNGISIARSSCPKPEMFANQIPATGMETERHNLISNNYITPHWHRFFWVGWHIGRLCKQCYH